MFECLGVRVFELAFGSAVQGIQSQCYSPKGVSLKKYQAERQLKHSNTQTLPHSNTLQDNESLIWFIGESSPAVGKMRGFFYFSPRRRKGAERFTSAPPRLCGKKNSPRHDHPFHQPSGAFFGAAIKPIYTWWPEGFEGHALFGCNGLSG